MSLMGIFEVSGSALSAQTVRMSTTASNLANADVVAENPEQTYRAKMPVFQTLVNDQLNTYQNTLSQSHQLGGVQVSEIVQSEKAFPVRYQPEHPYADENGYVTYSNVNTIEEMANMMAASRSFQNNVEVMQSTKQMMQRLLTLGQ